MINEDKVCLGCGKPIDVDYEYCERCFKLKNYGQVEEVTFDIDSYTELLKNNLKTKDLVVLVVDILNIPADFTFFKDIIKGKSILVLNKIDLLPKSVRMQKIMSKINGFDYIIPVSSKKRTGLDDLYKVINSHQGHIYLLGYANAGKSSLLNILLSSYTNTVPKTVTSHHAGTTLDLVRTKFLDKTIIDTPGLISENDIANNLTKSQVKMITPLKEIKPKTYIVKDNQSLKINDICRIEYQGIDNSLTFYIANQLNVERVNTIKNKSLTELNILEIEVFDKSDIVIQGLGFIKVVKPGKFKIYIAQPNAIFVRDAII